MEQIDKFLKFFILLEESKNNGAKENRTLPPTTKKWSPTLEHVVPNIIIHNQINPKIKIIQILPTIISANELPKNSLSISDLYNSNFFLQMTSTCLSFLLISVSFILILLLCSKSCNKNPNNRDNIHPNN